MMEGAICAYASFVRINEYINKWNAHLNDLENSGAEFAEAIVFFDDLTQEFSLYITRRPISDASACCCCPHEQAD